MDYRITTQKELRITVLENALRFLVEAAETEPGMAIYKAHIARAMATLENKGSNDNPTRTPKR